MIRTRIASFVAAGGFLLWPSPATPPRAAAPQLVYTAIVIRHGVRSPTWTDEKLRAYSSAPWPSWGVKPGELTARGGAIVETLGAYYRAAFAAQGLLPAAKSCADTARTFVRADNDQRTLETGRAIARGLMPSCSVSMHALPDGVQDALFDPTDGAVHPDGKLAAAAVLGRVGSNPNSLLDAHREAFDELDHILRGGGTGKRIADEPMAIAPNAAGTWAELTGALATASTLSEVMMLEYANGFSGADLGWGRLTETNLREVLTLHGAYAELMRRTPYLARTRGSNLLSHVLLSLQQAATGTRTPGALGSPRDAMLVIVGHDTNLSNLSGMLELSWLLPGYIADDTPPAGALVFSLWRDGATLSVRTQYIAPTLAQMRGAPLSLSAPPAIADVFVPGCGSAADGFACDWTAFQRTVNAAIDPAFVVR